MIWVIIIVKWFEEICLNDNLFLIYGTEYICNFFLRDWNNETKFHLTIPTKAKHSLTGIKIFTDNISCFLKISFRNFRSINGFGRRTMKNVRHLMWRVVNYDQFEGFTFHTQRKKECCWTIQTGIVPCPR